MEKDKYTADLFKNPVGRPRKLDKTGKPPAQRKKDQRDRLTLRAAAGDFSQSVCLHVLNNKQLREKYGVLACQELEKLLSK
ncbi:MAG: hypothetical protein EOO69_04580 [Moraxellaceae bacterium]|nr:MAG: hypothetical protein EOO69_04580 [Moraxellaceae bacterium]